MSDPTNTNPMVASATQAVPPPPPTRAMMEDISQQVERALQAAQAPAIARTQASQAIVDALRAQIAGETATIERLTNQLVPGVSDASVDAITSQIAQSQERLSSLQGQLDQALGTAQTSSQALPPPPPPPKQLDVPPGVQDVAFALFTTIAVVAIGVPIARALARLIDRRGAPAPVSKLPEQLEPRFDRIEHAIEAIAIEIERVSEGQRYTNKVMSEVRALPSPNPLEDWPKAGVKKAVPAERRDQG